jgi:asparagine synthetase B (glutamine-hydrolysing)
VLTVRRHAVCASRYWNPPAADLRVRHTEDIVDRFEHVFARAVARALEQGKAGIFLSGGVDSISVASMATQLALSARGQELPIALSLLYSDPDFHEAQIQRTVATSLGLPARQIALQDAIGQQTATESLLEANAKWPVPMLNLWLPAFMNLAQEGKALGCEVILTGGGGDEWLGVSPYFAADLIRSLRFLDLYRFCHKTLRSYDIGYRGLLRTLGWTFGIKPHLARVRDVAAALVNYDVDRRHSERRIPEWIGPEPKLREAMRDRYVIAARTNRARRASAPSLYDYEARRTLDHPIVVGEIENKFHVGQRVGVRMLEPYWDAELVELLYSTSPDDLSLGGFAKGLVHRLVGRALPELPVVRQRKIALSTAYTARVRREAQEGWTKMNGVPALAQLGIVDPDKVDKKVRGLLADPRSAHGWLIPHILGFEAWVRAHG